MLQMNPSSLIFPEIQPLPQVLGDPRLRSDVLLQIQSDLGTYAIFQSFTMQEQEYSAKLSQKDSELSAQKSELSKKDSEIEWLRA